MPRTLRRYGRTRLATAALVAVLVALVAPSLASAADYFVTTRDDHTDQQGCTLADCTLREAMNVGLTTQDIIHVPAGTYQLTSGQIVLPNGRLQGAGARSTIIEAAPSSRVIALGTEALATIADVTITGGNLPAGQGGGGGVWVPGSAAVAIVNSAVVGNTAVEGGGIFTQSTRAFVLNGTTVSGNTASSAGVTAGGGISVDAAFSTSSSVPAVLTNSTVSGNTASGGRATEGGGISTDGALTLNNSTVANNRVIGAGTLDGGGIFQGGGVGGGATPTTTIRSSIVAGNTGGACDGNAAIIAAWGGDHNLDDDASCGFSALGDKPGVNPLLGPLANNGGLTDTHALGAGSPAIDAGTNCPAADQRGVGRVGGCDIGAFEYVAPKLTVTTTVINDNGGSATPAAFRVHVARSGGRDVSGSPAPGSAAGSTYTLDPGSYVVSAGAVTGYAITIGGDCSAAGAVALGENQAKACTVIANDKNLSLSPPVIRKTANLVKPRGTVTIKLPGKKKFRSLKEDEQVPVGTTVNVKNGRITLITAADSKGGTANADFYDGIFKIGQTKGKKPITVLTLVEKLSCPASGNQATVAKKKTKKRRLWGDGKGHFRTKGRNSAATVLGTKWLVQDTCTTTLTKVARGKVSVRDFVKKKTVLVTKGHKYVARAKP
jgi:hypothetical protein